MAQTQTIINQLKKFGEVSRNWAIYKNSPGITRLGAIICNLKKIGWQIKTTGRNGDCVYKLIKSPDISPDSQIKPQEPITGVLPQETINAQSALFNLPEAPRAEKGHWEYN